ncbi:MAG: hypothetical protein A3H98_11690 [Bacteroidetes bacterium RIFCSPLOWO2_02_FULL_36_8]|nr:MAG: hypothetical protein A3H98_11690 [Bacteroidetes bacterium RIFCSPLOWO2_02_FULL_36_8]OFY71538.1 MAG: hypothetical protein A3G23_04645 [Bacteroidetes bacterium RIFCSPLOWO2_12_FULL_37_12]
MNFALKLQLLFLIIIFLAGCHSVSEKKVNNNILTDDLQREVSVNIPASVISLVPSITEILYAIGAESTILAVSQACSYPPEVKNKNVVTTYPAIDYESIYRIKPDLVLVSTEIFQQDIIHRFEELSIPVFFLAFHDKNDIFKAIKKLGEITGNDSKALQISDSLKNLLNSFISVHNHSTHPRTLILVSNDPLIAVGKNSFISDLLTISGGNNIIDFDSPDAYPQVSREFILKADPEIILMPGGKKSINKIFYTFPELSKTKAYLNKSVIGIQSEAFVRPSTRFVEVIKELHEYLYNEKKN